MKFLVFLILSLFTSIHYSSQALAQARPKEEMQTLAMQVNDKPAEDYARAQEEIFNKLTENVKAIGAPSWRMTPITPLKPSVVPLFWGNHKAFTRDIEYPQNSYPPVAVAASYSEGRVVALSHDGLMIDPDASVQLINNSIGWLRGILKNKKIIIYTHISNWFRKNKIATGINDMLSIKGIQVVEHSTEITDESLKQCDVLIIVRPTQNITESEIEVITSFVAEGGGLLMTGMGWYWSTSHPFEEFPLNRLGGLFGFKYSKYIIHKTYETNERYIRAYNVFPFQLLSERGPTDIVHFSSSEHTDECIHESVETYGENCHYTLEGNHIIVSMPYAFFRDLEKPTEFIGTLDTVYQLNNDFTGGIRPFGGEKILVLNVDNLNYHMTSGNPILSRRDRVTYILEEWHKSNHKTPTWGLAHELGHDCIIALKHIFIFGDGDNEGWAEFFALHAFDKLNINQEHMKNPFWLDSARKYHNYSSADFNKVKDDGWLMTGLLDTIRKKYGWEVFERFLMVCTETIIAGNYPETEEEKADFLVKELSLAAGANVYPCFKKWDFPVSQYVNDELKHLPKAKLFE
jgi:hypothetical protein